MGYLYRKYPDVFWAVLVFTLLAMTTVEAAVWYDLSWKYRKGHIVGSATGAGTNFQVKVTTYYGSGTDSAGNVYLNSRSNTDFSDIRFTASDNSTLLDHWQESRVDSNNAVFWVEISDDISANPANIYLYYGNSGATTASNGDNTFLFFDDFSGTLSKWTIDAENTDKVAISSGALRHDADPTQSKGSYFDTRIITSSYRMLNGVVEYQTYLAGAPRIIHQFGYRVNSLSFTNGYCYRVQNSTADGGNLYFNSGAWTGFGTTAPAVSGGAWHNVQVKVSGSTFWGSVDGGTVYSGVNASKGTLDYLVSHVHGVTLSTTTSYVLVDNVRVRKYVATEPTQGAWGYEETTPSVKLQNAKINNAKIQK
jgi:hypothetical protein